MVTSNPAASSHSFCPYICSCYCFALINVYIRDSVMHTKLGAINRVLKIRQKNHSLFQIFSCLFYFLQYHK